MANMLQQRLIPFEEGWEEVRKVRYFNSGVGVIVISAFDVRNNSFSLFELYST
jgi:hypothetical protein